MCIRDSNLAMNYAILGDIDTSRKHIKKCLEIDSDYPNAKKMREDLEKLISVSAGTIGNN